MQDLFEHDHQVLLPLNVSQTFSESHVSCFRLSSCKCAANLISPNVFWKCDITFGTQYGVDSYKVVLQPSKQF